MSSKILDDARHEVLAENTAQAVYKHLSKLYSEESRFRKRWVWELLQNARDASLPTGVHVWLIQRPDSMIFRHSGVPFNYKSIAHLIYHGSTKYNLTGSGPIGQFGTGFLTTHLISKKVWVKGKMDDGKSFAFILDRGGENADQLGSAMEASWRAFVESLSEDKRDTLEGFETEYEYPLEQGVYDVVEEGVDDLIENAAYVLAFNELIRSIRLEHQDRDINIRKQELTPLDDGSQLLHVEEQASVEASISRYVAIVTCDRGTSVAVELSKNSAQWSIAELGNTPRIFVAFPLTGTRDFCLPVVANHEKFQPREDRDTLVLLPNREGKHENMDLMEDAWLLAARLAVFATKNRWNSASTLVCLNKLRRWEWVDAKWLRDLIVDCFIQPLRSEMIITTVSNEMISPSNGVIPLAPGSASCTELWDMAVHVKDISKRLPHRAEAEVWAETLTAWASFIQKPVENLEEALTLEKLCGQVSACGILVELRNKLKESIDPIEWLIGLHLLIIKAEKTALFEQMRLIPSQKGTLRKITELRRDSGIDEDLKDIAESLGLPTRAGLLDPLVCKKELFDLQPQSQEEVLTAAMQKLKDKVEKVDDEFADIAVRFFAWLVNNDQMGKLDGFPVLTRVTLGEKHACTTLIRGPNKTDQRLLAPSNSWPEAALLVKDLFPKGKTLSDAYWKALPDVALWIPIAEEGYVRLNPLYGTQRRVPFIPDEPLPVSEKEKKLKHRTMDQVNVSALAFFEKDEAGLDRVRRSKIRATRLLQFLVHFVLKEDKGALQPIEAECECGEKHRYYGASWLVPMWERRWVPIGENKQSSATAESIVKLYKGKEDELRELAGGSGRKLFEALNISIADLSLRAIARDENTRISLIDSLAYIASAAGNDPEKVRLVAEEIKQTPRLLDEISEHREKREKIKRNQSIGAKVERLLKEAMQKHGLKVTRTGHGSDYEVEEDFLVEDNEILLNIENGQRSFLIEVKSTTGKMVRMTVKQAQTAVANKERFALCVIQLDSADATVETIHERARFVMGIGSRLEPVWEEYRRYQVTKREACERVGEIELIVHDSEVRFSVTEGAWENGLSLQDAVEEILRVCRMHDIYH